MKIEEYNKLYKMLRGKIEINYDMIYDKLESMGCKVNRETGQIWSPHAEFFGIKQLAEDAMEQAEHTLLQALINASEKH